MRLSDIAMCDCRTLSRCVRKLHWLFTTLCITGAHYSITCCVRRRTDNDNTLFCYPRQETLSDMTHLSRSTVIAALRSLKARGFVDWKKGGKTVKRRKVPRRRDELRNATVDLENSRVNLENSTVNFRWPFSCRNFRLHSAACYDIIRGVSPE